MDIYVREKNFVNKKNETINYNEFYIKFLVQTDKVEEVEIVLKFDEKHAMAKSLILSNLDLARFDINTRVTDKGVYHNPIVIVPVGKKDYNIPVDLNRSDVTLIRVAIAQNLVCGF